MFCFWVSWHNKHHTEKGKSEDGEKQPPQQESEADPSTELQQETQAETVVGNLQEDIKQSVREWRDQQRCLKVNEQGLEKTLSS